ncbi:MAG TPA: tRNA (guanosine(46)-N7)-methyltransferase TrmB [Phycisphaerales bacterium]|nr:tRNA (guanosine(46)-N7)-methyltransferase TrmB [Phycisphaerales bacterium]|tara:strand:- start:1336 stop:2001 length:666 start_codon:yes stop_codon:yes gene_type:complete
MTAKTAVNLDIGHTGKDQTHLDAFGSFEDGPYDLSLWFDVSTRKRPMELEIGSGKGTFLVNQSPEHPDINYIGVEYAKAYWRHAADRIRRHSRENVRMVHAEAGFFVRNYIADGVFQQVHIYFPDPWPKAKHNKRRLVQAPFLRELHRILTPTGQIRLATDHEDYFHWMEDHAAQVDDLYERLAFISPESAGDGELVGTNFERKYRREGRPFNAMILRKRS